MKRKTRTRYIWCAKEDGFICGKCGAIGGCGDDKNTKEKMFWDKDEEKITCKCGHQLTTKNELEKKLKIREIHNYGFWLRFASAHFNLCEQCQDNLHNLLMGSNLKFYDSNCITLTKRNGEWVFRLNFVRCQNLLNTKAFTVCKNCQFELGEIMIYNELHIGNDTKPMIELWRRWQIIDE